MSRILRGLLDTFNFLLLAFIPEEELPERDEFSAITLAEVLIGAPLARSEAERFTRQQQAATALTAFTPIPFGKNEAIAYRDLGAALHDRGASFRSRRNDLMIAATAMVHDLPVLTLDSKDFSTISQLVGIGAELDIRILKTP